MGAITFPSAISDRYARVLLPLMLLVHLCITMPLAASLNIWLDEAWTLRTTGKSLAFAWNQALYGEIQAPFYFLLMWVWRSVSASVFWARIFSVLCAAAVIVVCAALARKLFSERVAAWTTVVVALHPYLIWSALEVRLYALMILLSACMMLAFLNGYVFEPTGRNARRAFLVLTVLALYTQYYLGFVVVACAVALLVTRRWHMIKPFILDMTIAGLLFAPFLLVVREQMRGNAVYAGLSLTLLGSAKLVWWHTLDMLLPAKLPLLVTLRLWFVRAAMVAAPLVVWRFRKRISAQSIVVAPLAITVFVCLCLAGLSAGTGLLQLRHIAGLFVPAVLLGFWLLTLVAPRRGWLVVAPIVALCALVLVQTYSVDAKRGDWNRVAQFIMQHESVDQPVLVFHGGDALAFSYYYAGRNKVVPSNDDTFRWEPRVGTDNALSYVEQVDYLAGLLPPHKELWLVSSLRCESPEDMHMCGPLEYFVADNYEVESNTAFFGERVRLLRRKPVDQSLPR